MGKDPALRRISTEFLLNLVANLRRLGIEHFLILTTRSLCATLHEHCLFACAWTSLWETRPGLARWGLKPGDMFLMWAQQWYYLSRAVERGISVLRADTDVYFAEDPYPILHGPLLAPFAMVVQQDFGGPLGSRPSCPAGADLTSLAARHRPPGGAHAEAGSELDRIGSCGRHAGTSLLNIGLVYVRAARGGVRGGGGGGAARAGPRAEGRGGALAVVNGTWVHFLRKMDEPRAGGVAAPAPQHVEALIDQPLMRAMVSRLSIPDRAASKPRNKWTVVPGSAAEVYAHDERGERCALRDRARCAEVRRERRRTAFLAQLVSAGTAATADRIALAPDWLFGRGCLSHVRNPNAWLQAAAPELPRAQTVCAQPPPGGAMPAPGPAGGILVATHFVYSMALKRKRAFRAFGWDAASARAGGAEGNRSSYAPGTCWNRSRGGILFGHTFFEQTARSKTVLCAMPSGEEPECACCAGLPSMARGGARSGGGLSGGLSGLQLETTAGRGFSQNQQRATKIEGCADYQLFWDR